MCIPLTNIWKQPAGVLETLGRRIGKHDYLGRGFTTVIQDSLDQWFQDVLSGLQG